MAKKILFVDDEPDILKLTTFRLKNAGYEVLSATNGKEAMDLIKSTVPDLILLDWNMPLVNGEQFCKQLRSDNSLKHIPVILFSATVNRLKDKVAEFGADDYLPKPYTPEDLLGKVEKFIG